MSTSGPQALIWQMREVSSGCPQGVPLPLQIGMLENQITSATRMARRKTAWNCGIAMARDSSGMILHAVLRLISSVKYNKNHPRIEVKLLRKLTGWKHKNTFCTELPEEYFSAFVLSQGTLYVEESWEIRSVNVYLIIKWRIRLNSM